MRSVIGIVVTTVVLVACSTSSDPATTTGAADITTTAPASRFTTNTSAIDPTTTTAEATSTSEASPPIVSGPILVAGEAGVVLIDGERTSTLLDEPVSVAADDLMGGVVYQASAAESGFGEPEDTIIWWLPDGADSPRTLLVPTGDQRLRLIGVARIDGSPSVVYVRRDSPGDFENALDTLRLYDFDTAQVTEVRVVGGWESGVGQVTYGGGVFASNWFGEAYSGFEFFDVAGADLGAPADPYPGDAICFDGTLDPGGGACFNDVVISLDGERIAYTVLLRDEDGVVQALELVVADADDGSELHRVTLRTEEPFSVHSIELSGDLVLYNLFALSTEREPLPATVLDLSTGRSASLAMPGTARFAPTLSEP